MRIMGALALVAGLAMIAGASLACGEEADDDDDTSTAADEVEADEVSSNQADSPPPSTRPSEECADLTDDPIAHQACKDCVAVCNLAVQSDLSFENEQCIAEEIIEDWACEVTVFTGMTEDNSCAKFPSTVHNRISVDKDCAFVSTSVVY
ncbi:hypothetical protein KDL45_05840 [bacterium]|nr:hypothetical protein [bacterium]MCB9476423.1 hypothetical protein [Deltaproteobacteria bacterium]MCB9478398.1 hypothetical protein [Deltaproteobacteria bacterium]